VSRLDSAIRRLQAQRACLDLAVAQIRDVDGPVLELGLGNGRTYDHLRSLLPAREIFVFEREVRAHPDCIPPARYLLMGDFRETVPQAGARIGVPAALIHADIGSGDKAATASLAGFLGPALAPLLAPAGVVVADQALEIPGCRPLPLPEDVASGRYFMYRYQAATP